MARKGVEHHDLATAIFSPLAVRGSHERGSHGLRSGFAPMYSVSSGDEKTSKEDSKAAWPGAMTQRAAKAQRPN